MPRLWRAVAIALVVLLFFGLVDLQATRSWSSAEASTGYWGRPLAGGQLRGAPGVGDPAPIEVIYLGPDWATKVSLRVALTKGLAHAITGGPSGIDLVAGPSGRTPGRPALVIYSLDVTLFYTPFFSTARATLTYGYASDSAHVPEAPPDPKAPLEPFLGGAADQRDFSLRGEISLEMKSAGLMTWPAFRRLVWEELARQAAAEIDRAWNHSVVDP